MMKQKKEGCLNRNKIEELKEDLAIDNTMEEQLKMVKMAI